MKKIIIYGAGGFGREVVEIIKQINIQKATWEILGFVDDTIANGEIIDGFKVIGDKSYLNSLNEKTAIIIAIGNPTAKGKIISQITNSNVFYPILIHPNVVLPSSKDMYEIGEGTVICPFSFVSINTKIGKHVLINVNCTVGHDTEIGDYSCLMPSVNVSGNVFLDKRTYAGVGSKIINKVNVTSDVTIGAGSVVVKDVESSGTLMGVPARMIIKN